MPVKIDTVAARQSLPPRPAPYFIRLEKGGYLGFRKIQNGAGTWIARWRDEHGKQHNHAIGTFDTYDAACKAARAWIDNAKGGVIEDINVEEACQRYVEDRRKEKGDDTARDAEGRFRRTVDGTKFGKLKLSSLKTQHIVDWRNGLVDIDEEALDDDPDAERRAKDSANRNLATLKAALNLSYRMGLVSSTAQWDRVDAYKKVGQRRQRFLTVAERKKLLLASPPALQSFLKALLLTACRPGELANCKISDFQNTGILSVTGKTGRREIPVSPDALKLFQDCANERDDNEPLLVRADGKGWTRFDWRDGVKDARQAAGLGDDVVAYSLRHAGITEMIVSGIDLLTVARLTGTSVQMIESNYGHLAKDQVVAKLAKVKMV